MDVEAYHPAGVPPLATRHSDDVFLPTKFEDLVKVECPFEVDVTRVFHFDVAGWVVQRDQLQLGRDVLKDSQWSQGGGMV